MKTRKVLAGSLGIAILATTLAAHAAGLFTNGVPVAGGTQYPTTLPLTGAETIPADTNLSSGLNPQSEAITTAQLAAYIGGANTSGNILIGGDATTNLFQRATTGSSVTTTLTYGGPDRWAYWSGTNTAMTVSQTTTAADLTAGFPAAFKMARTNAQTGVVQMCMAQEVETALVKASGLAGSTAELTWNVVPGALFSAASGNMTAYIVTGTGSDQGLAGTASMAFALNAGGGGSGGWTGQANATAAVVPVSTAGRFAAVASIPATATEIGVALCFTPVGTAGASDYLAISGVQLKKNPALATKVSASVGYSCTSAGIQCSSFERRSFIVEQQLQQRYFYKITEGSAIQTRGQCFNSDVTHANCMIYFPTPMRIAPVFTGDGGFTAGFATPTTTAGTTLGNCSAVAVSTLVTSTVAGTNNVVLTCTATTVPAAGTTGFLYDNGGSGVIKGSAEL